MSSPGANQSQEASLAAAAPVKAVPRRTSLDALLRHGSLPAAAVGQAGLGLGLGSQDLTGLLLDPSFLQHMQSLPRTGTGIELDLLASPKWKALLNWEGDIAATAGRGHSMEAMGSGESAAPSSTAFHLAGLDEEGAPISPGVDQHLSAAALEAAWRAAQQAQQAQQGSTSVPPVLVPQKVVQPQLQQAVHRRGFGGKKRPGPEGDDSVSEAEAAGQAASKAEEQAAVPRPTKQRRTEQHPNFMPAVPAVPAVPAGVAAELGLARGHSLTTFSSEDTLMLEAEVAAAFESELGPKEDLSPTDVLTGLNRVRLSSIGSPRTHRRLTAAAAAAAVSAAGRRGQLRRGESNVPMLDAALPGSPTGAQLLMAAGDEPGVGRGASLPTVQPKLKTLASSSGPSAGASSADLAPAATAAAAEVAACAPMPMTSFGSAVLPAMATSPVPDGGQVERRLTSTGRQQLPTKSHKAVATGEGGVFTSAYRGVTRHRLTGRYEAHYWDSSYVRPNVKKGGRSKGRQVYLGGYETELEAARAYDRAVLAYVGASSPLNFPLEDYDDDLVWMAGRTAEEVVGILRRGSVGFARGQSQYRGVTRHHQAQRWEARIGKVVGDKYLYLGSYGTPEEAAHAYDRACVKYRGAKAILNFDLSHYQDILEDPDSYDPVAAAAASSTAAADSPTPAPQAAAAGPWAAGGFGGTWGSKAAAGQPAGLKFPGGMFGSAAGMMAGLPTIDAQSLLFFPLLQQQALAASMQQQFVMPAQMAFAQMQLPLPSPAHQAKQEQHYAAQSAFQPAAPPVNQQQAAQPTLRPIRTRAGVGASAAAAAGGSASAGAGAGSMPPPPQVPQAGASGGVAFGGAGLDFAELLSPLAASLLTPLGLNGSPAGWKDSPLSRLSTGQLARLLSSSLEGSGGSGLLNSLLSPTSAGSGHAANGSVPGQHRLATGSAAGTPGSGGGSGSNNARGLTSDALCRLFSSPTSEAELFSALQWLDSLPQDQLAQLAAMEAAPTGAGMAGNMPAGGSGGAAAGNAGTPAAPVAGGRGAVRRNNSSNASNKA